MNYCHCDDWNDPSLKPWLTNYFIERGSTSTDIEDVPRPRRGNKCQSKSGARGPSASTAGLRLLACFLIRTLPSPSLILPLFFQSVIHQQSLSMSGPVLAPDLGPGSQPTRMTREFSSQHACHSSATRSRQRKSLSD